MRPRCAVLLALVLAGGSRALAQKPECVPAERASPAVLLRNAERALGVERLGARVLRLRATDAILQDYQSDRAYPPYFLGFAAREVWYRPATGVSRYTTHLTFPFGEADFPPVLAAAQATYQVRDTSTIPSPAAHGSALTLRGLDPWAQVHDWRATRDVSVAGECTVRDYRRLVLERTGPHGRERLALDPKTGLPVELQREEPHYLWGQVAVRYVYSNWKLEGGLAYPGTGFRVVDGVAEISRTVAAVDPMPADSAPALALPDTVEMAPVPPPFLTPSPPAPVRVGAASHLLVNPGYTHGVALLGDTLYVLDATQGEERARADSALIARLYPGSHPVVLVVTDVAWPHVAGLRYWVARGATVVSHRISRPFLERVLERRWTRAPDLYERRRAAARLAFRPVDDSLSLAGGRLRVYAIDGPGSEGGLMAYLEPDRFLWAGDYIQTVRQPSTYALEVWRAVRRAGIEPGLTAAQHLPLTPWAVVDSLAGAP